MGNIDIKNKKKVSIINIDTHKNINKSICCHNFDFVYHWNGRY